MSMLISVVIPLYRCASSIPDLVSRLHTSLSQIDSNYEILLVNDASPENDWVEVQKQVAKSDKVKGINLSRNFGQHYAIAAGLDYSQGRWVVVMDGDLQDAPEEIINLYETASDNYDVVFARRAERQDSYIKKNSSKYFYKLLGYLTDTIQDETIANFGIYSRGVVDAICSMNDYSRYFPTMVKWVGFKTTALDVKHDTRHIGKSSYDLRRLTNLALDVMIVFSDKPLRLTVKLGLVMALTSFLVALYNVIRYMLGEVEVTGWTTLVISIWFLSGLIVFILGILGLYLGKVFDQVKGRPKYIVMDVI